MEILLRAFPPAVLGVILFFAGTLLVTGNLPVQATKQQAFIFAVTAGLVICNVSAAFAAGLVLHDLDKHGYLER